jgi:hypothetical protein
MTLENRVEMRSESFGWLVHESLLFLLFCLLKNCLYERTLGDISGFFTFQRAMESERKGKIRISSVALR